MSFFKTDYPILQINDQSGSYPPQTVTDFTLDGQISLNTETTVDSIVIGYNYKVFQAGKINIRVCTNILKIKYEILVLFLQFIFASSSSTTDAKLMKAHALII